jgi:hypothetical protein
VLVGTQNFSEAILRPAAAGLSDITIEGLIFLIFPCLIADSIASILLPRPEIKIARLSKGVYLMVLILKARCEGIKILKYILKLGVIAIDCHH